MNAAILMKSIKNWLFLLDMLGVAKRKPAITAGDLA
jgi:hypothetical protein